MAIYKGDARRLDDIDLPKIGSEIGVGEDVIHALIEVETRGTGFDNQGRVIILFEPHVFYKHLRGEKRKLAESQGLAYPKWGMRKYPRDSYPRLEQAMRIDETAALMSCSWGMGQVMGENFHMVGYDSVQQMVEAFAGDEETHLQAMVDFIKAAGIDDDLRRIEQKTKSGGAVTAADWVPVVRVYNGAGYAANDYHNRAARAYQKWLRIKDTAYAPASQKEAARLEEEEHQPKFAEEAEPLALNSISMIADSMGEGTSPHLRRILGSRIHAAENRNYKRGTMTSYWEDRVDDVVRAEHPEKVLILLGTNDAYNNRSTEEITRSVHRIVDALAGTPFLWAGPPASPKIKPETLERVVRAIVSVVGEENFHDTRRLRLGFYDGIHPQPKSFAAWAQFLAKRLVAPPAVSRDAAPPVVEETGEVDELTEQPLSGAQDEKGVTTESAAPAEAEGSVPPAPAEEIKASQPSLWTRIGIIGSAVAAFFVKIGLDIRDAGQQGLDIAKEHPVGTLFLLAIILGLFWLWNQSKNRAHERTLKILDAAADKDKNNLRLV
jgi:hypothetical protein